MSFEGSEDFENLNEKQQHYFLRLAHSTIAINKLADEALVAQRKSNEKRVEKVHEENEQRRELAAKLRAEAEEYQEQIEVKIKEAQEYLNERKYKEALNAGREGEALLTGEKNSVLHLWRKAMAGAMKLLIGKEKDCKEFFDVIIQEYHREFQHTIKLAEAGLQYE